ncbi:MAG: hypothetical protein AAF483_14060 [Planctomycetota bacterium]
MNGGNKLTQFHLKLEQYSESVWPEGLLQWVESASQFARSFWDRLPQRPHPEWTECDYFEVAQALLALQAWQAKQNCWPAENRFLECGCGFAAVSGIAQFIGYQAIGVESELILVQAAQKCLATLPSQIAKPEIWNGNFLPEGAVELAQSDDPRVSLKCELPAVYELQRSSFASFDAVFAYAWPGEEFFLRSVFREFARPFACLVLYRGPNQIEFYQKQIGAPESG